MESSNNNTSPQKKKIFFPIVLGAGIALNFFIILLVYGPRKRGSWLETTMNPSRSNPFEQWQFDTLSPFGQTLCAGTTIVSFVLGTFLMYKYVNRPKLKKGEDIE